jgi:type I restriction enzyme M protein
MQRVGCYDSMIAQSKLFESKIAQQELEQWLWDAACSIRGPLDAPSSGAEEYISPLLFFKRLSDFYQDELLTLDKALNDKRKFKQFVPSRSTLAQFRRYN